MKKIITTVILVVAVSISYAQNSFLGITLGYSIPSNDFGSSDFNNANPGFAKPGLALDINYAYLLYDNWGVAALIRVQANPIDEAAIKSEFEASLQGSNWTVSADNWSIGGYMGGLYRQFPTKKDGLTANVRAMFGFLTSKSPKMIMETADYGGGRTIQYEATASAFAYLLGIGFRKDIGKKMAFQLNADYLGSNPEFKDVEYSSEPGEVTKATFTQKYTTVNISFGVAYKW